MKILFVCTGNTCRSPMAEYIAREQIKKDGLDISVLSAGMMEEGCPASENSTAVCREIGIDLTAHRSRVVTLPMMEEADIIFAMTHGHKEEILRHGVQAEKIRILGDGIPDPYGMGIEVYRQCRDKIQSAIVAFIDSLKVKTSEVRIVPLEKKHAKKLAELEKLCFSEPWSEEGIAYEADNESARFLVAMCGDEIAGYVGLMFAADFAGVCNLAVFPEYRRRGIGRALMKALIEICVGLDVEVLSLEVRASGSIAIALYSELGFEKVGVRKNFYQNPTEDAIVMNKRL